MAPDFEGSERAPVFEGSERLRFFTNRYNMYDIRTPAIFDYFLSCVKKHDCTVHNYSHLTSLFYYQIMR